MLLAILTLSLGAPDLLGFDQRVEVSVSERLEDLVLIDGRVDVQGMVQGHLYALDSDVFIRKTAAIVKSLTVFGGSLHLEEGAVLPNNIDVWDIDFYGPEGQSLPPGSKLALSSGSTVSSLPANGIAADTHALTKSVLRFRRSVPPPGQSLKNVSGWTPGMGLASVGGSDELATVEIGGLLRLKFVSERIVGALQRGFKGPRGAARLTVIELDSSDSAQAFWGQIAKADPRGQVSATVKSSLGDGAHWFFLHRNRSTTAWQRGRWVIAVESTLFADSASNLQHQRFNRQLVSSLENSFEQSGATSRMSQGAVP